MPTVRIDKKARLLARIFCFAFALALIKALYDGGFGYHSIGHEKYFTVGSNPLKFYFGIAWYFLIFLVSAYFGFFAKLKK